MISSAVAVAPPPPALDDDAAAAAAAAAPRTDENSSPSSSSSSVCAAGGGGGGTCWTDHVAISTAEAMNAARRSTMEDVCVVDRNFGARRQEEYNNSNPDGTNNENNSSSNYNNNNDTNNNCKETILVGVYDGHGGREMVDFLRHGLSYHVAQEWFAANHDDDNDNNSSSNNNNSAPAAAAVLSKQQRLERAFLMADLHAHQVGISTSGATVALCLIEKDDNDDNANCYHVTTANVGDSRIVLGRISTNDNNNNHATAIRLTTDHRLNDPLEVARIEQAGGFLFRNRVCGVLAVTRSLGDQILKPYVIATPTVREETVVSTAAAVARGNRSSGTTGSSNNAASSSSFLIVACDGLWDVMSDDEAVRLVQVHGSSKNPNAAAAEHLVQEALRRGTSDNVTVAVVWLP